MCHRYKFQLTVEAAIKKYGIDFVDYQWLESEDFYPLKTVPAIRGGE